MTNNTYQVVATNGHVMVDGLPSEGAGWDWVRRKYGETTAFDVRKTAPNADYVRPLAEVVAERDALVKVKAWRRVAPLTREIRERTARVELAQDAYYYGTAADVRPAQIDGSDA